ncbi:MAG TPA: neutral/alkaline non-lysosomal ceramidase N-terminal domain-containing protein [Jiangellaceae bacterium]
MTRLPGVRAGAGTAVVPVPAGTRMDGYGDRRAASTGTLRPLEANALVLEVDGGTAVLVTVDAVAVDAELTRVLRAAVGEEHGIAPERVLVAASHTHAGPAGLRGSDPGAGLYAGQPMRATYLDAMLRAVRDALAGTRAATLSAQAETVRGVATHRREPERAIDDTATLVTVDDSTGRPIAMLWHFACHATVLDAGNTLISPDLPGEVRELLRARAGAAVPTLYLPGAGGDVSTRFTRRGHDPAELDRLARLVVDAWTTASSRLRMARPRIWRETIQLPTTHDTPHEILRRLSSATAGLAGTAVGPARRAAETTVRGLQRRLDRVRSDASVDAVDVELHALTFGDLAIAALPGEPMAATGLALRRSSTRPLTLPTGYANGYVGYLPTADTVAGYEAEVAVVEPGAVSAAVDWFAARLGPAELS